MKKNEKKNERFELSGDEIKTKTVVEIEIE